ncbi:MAG: hypothetical protein JSU90_07100 [Nitrospiraceae bacterium]|nr:MAG: hypothetical protein JSU90_07100 [Nitrospiraceae bacterium]
MKTKKDTLLSQGLSIFALVMFALTLVMLPLVPQATQTAHAQGAAYHSTSHFGMAALAEHELRLQEQNALDSAANRNAHAAAALQVDKTTIQPLKNHAHQNIHKNVQERK